MSRILMTPLGCLLSLLLLSSEVQPVVLPSPSASGKLPDIVDLWDRKQPVVTERRFMKLLPRARAAKQTAYVAELLANIARARAHQRKFEAARAALDEAKSLLDAKPADAIRMVDSSIHGSIDGSIHCSIHTVQRARAAWLLETGRYLRISSGRHAATAPSARDRIDRALRMKQMRSSLRAAYESALSAGAVYYAIDASHLLGLSDRGVVGIAWNLAAIRLAETSRDEKVRDWLGVLYENTARSFHRLRRFEEALGITRRGLAWAEQRNDVERTRMFSENITTLEKLASRRRTSKGAEGHIDRED